MNAVACFLFLPLTIPMIFWELLEASRISRLSMMQNSKASILLETETNYHTEKVELYNNPETNSNTPVLTGHNAKLYKCDICDAAFTRPYHLITHTRKHTGERPFQCNICDKTFTQRSNLTTHMKLHSGLKTFQCKTCSKVFSRKYHLLRHLETHAREGHDVGGLQQGGLRAGVEVTESVNGICNPVRARFDYDSQEENEFVGGSDPTKEKNLQINYDNVLPNNSLEPSHRKTDNRALEYGTESNSFSEQSEVRMWMEPSHIDNIGHTFGRRPYSDKNGEKDGDVIGVDDVKTMQCGRCDMYLSRTDFNTHFLTCTCNCSQDDTTMMSCVGNGTEVPDKATCNDTFAFSNHDRTSGRKEGDDIAPDELVLPRSSFRCGSCERTFLSQSDFQQHVLTRHQAPVSVNGVTRDRCRCADDACKDPHCKCEISEIGSPTW